MPSTPRRCAACSSTRRASTRCPTASCATSATPSCCTTRTTRSRSGTASRRVRWPDEPDAFDRRLTEIARPLRLARAGSRTSGRRPLHDAPADLVARLEANGFRDMGDGLRDGRSSDPEPAAARRAARHGPAVSLERLARPARRPRRRRRVERDRRRSCCDAFDVEERAAAGRRGRDGGLARRTRRSRTTSSGSTAQPAAVARRATFDGRELPLVDRDGRLGPRARPRRARDADRDRRRRRGRQRVDLPRGLRRQRAGHPAVPAGRVRDQSGSRPRTCCSSGDRRPSGPRSRPRSGADRRRAVAGRRDAARPSAGRRSSSTGPRRSSPALDLEALPDDVALGAACRAAIDRDGPIGPALVAARTRDRGPAGARARAPRRGPGRRPGGTPTSTRPTPRGRRDALLPPVRSAARSGSPAARGGRDGRFRFLRSTAGRVPSPHDRPRDRSLRRHAPRRRPGRRRRDRPALHRRGLSRPDRATSSRASSGSRRRTPGSIVAEHDGAILGFIAVHALPRFEHDDRILRILALVVDAGARERGVGRTLMAEAERIGARARRRVRRDHRRPPPSGGAPPVRVARLRRDRRGLPAQEALSPLDARPTPRSFPRLRLRDSAGSAARPALGAPARRVADGRRSTSGTSRSGRRATSSGSSCATSGPTPSRRSRSSVATTEFDVLRHLEDAGPAGRHGGRPGRRRRSATSAILMTEYLAYSIQYRRLLMRFPLGPGPYRDRLLDAMAWLLVDLHRAGVFWGDCSLANTLFRRDGDKIQAFLVDAETSEIHPRAVRRPARPTTSTSSSRTSPSGSPTSAALQGRPEAFDDAVGRRRDGPHALHLGVGRSCTSSPSSSPDDRHAIRARIRRLNDLGFAVDEIDARAGRTGRGDRSGCASRSRTAGSTPASSERLTGLVALEGQARLLLNDLREYRAWLEFYDRRPVGEAGGAERWLARRPRADARARSCPAVGAGPRPAPGLLRRPRGEVDPVRGGRPRRRPRGGPRRPTSALGAPAPEDDRAGRTATIALDIDWSGGFDTRRPRGRLRAT